jgi:hypothetical protein
MPSTSDCCAGVLARRGGILSSAAKPSSQYREKALASSAKSPLTGGHGPSVDGTDADANWALLGVFTIVPRS